MYEFYSTEPKYRTKRLSTNLSVDEFNVVKLKMEELGLRKVSDYLRLMALGESQYPLFYVPPVNVQLSSTVKTATSNLNQLVKHLNENAPDEQKLREAWEQREILGNLLRRTVESLEGQIDYPTVKRLATEMIFISDLQEAINERTQRGLS